MVSIFRTTLKTQDNVNYVSSLLDAHPHIASWSVDIEDIDNVLRVVSNGSLDEKDLIPKLENVAFFVQNYQTKQYLVHESDTRPQLRHS